MYFYDSLCVAHLVNTRIKFELIKSEYQTNWALCTISMTTPSTNTLNTISFMLLTMDMTIISSGIDVDQFI